MTLETVLVLVCGATIGLVMAHANGPGGSAMLRWAAFAQVLVAGAAALALDIDSTWVPALVGVAAYLLAGGYVWRRSPLLDGEGYWFRVWFVLRDRGDLAAAEEERRHRLAPDLGPDLEEVDPGRG